MSSALPDELRALLGELVSDIGERVYLRSDESLARRADNREAEVRGQRRSARSDVSVISAPVYDHHQRQAMVVSLQTGRALTDPEINKRAQGLISAADVLTAQLGGVKPWR